MKTKRIIYIWGRNYTGRLYTMPFGLNVLYYLLKEGYKVEIYLFENPSQHYKDILPSGTKINFVGYLINHKYNRVKYLRVLFKFFLKFGCKNIIAVGQMGAVAAQSIFGRKKNIAYFNDEFTSIYKIPFFASIEKKLIKDASIIALPDKFRQAGLESDIGLKIPQEKVVEFINSPAWITKENLPVIDWHNRLRIEKSKRIVLFSGGVAPFLQITETLMSVKLWDEEFVLVLNSPNLQALRNFRVSHQHLEIEGRIYWLEEQLSEAEFHSLIAASFCNICLYSNVNPNLATVGKSSGKAMRSLLLGVPVICSDLPSFDFVKQKQLGICIHHPMELCQALIAIKNDENEFLQRCQSFATHEMNTQLEYEVFIKAFLNR